MNEVNPNDTLARRVIDIAKHNRTGDAFMKGELRRQVSDCADVAAASTFYKFPEDAILSLHTRILVHQSQAAQNGHSTRRGSNSSPPRMLAARGGGGERTGKVDGMDHDQSDRIAAEPSRKGGLTRAGKDVRLLQGRIVVFPS
jgi:pre-mRNA-splicing factor ATP-dependent RNA helicase DHX38/PRP16